MEGSDSSDDEVFRRPDEPGPSFKSGGSGGGHGGKRRGSGRKRSHQSGYKGVQQLVWKSIGLHWDVHDKWMVARERHGFHENNNFAEFLLEYASRNSAVDETSDMHLSMASVSSVGLNIATNLTERINTPQRSTFMRNPHSTSTPRGENLRTRLFTSGSPTPSTSVEYVNVLIHEKVFIDSVIRNTSIAMEDRDVDSDDENVQEDVPVQDESADESGDDVHCESEDGNGSSDDNCLYNAFDDFGLSGSVQQLNITCDKDTMEHGNGDVTQLEFVDMDTSLPQVDVGLIECNIPVIDGQNPSVRLLPNGYEGKYTGLEGHLSSVNEDKFICSMSSIKYLFSFCMDIDCGMPLVDVKETFVGCVLEIRWKCQSGHCGQWQSSKSVNNLYVNNIQTAAALLYTGNNYTKISLMAKCLSLALFSSSTYYQYQKKYLAPQVQSWWNDMQESIFSAIGNQPVVVTGDGQMDSPGFCAKNCTYTLMHHDLDYILHVEQIDVRHSQLKSVVMEKVGCERALDFVMKKLVIQELVTDASSQVIKLLATSEKYKDVIHQLDIWHKSNKLDKKLLEAGKKKRNEILKSWIAPIRNHFWHCSKDCGGVTKKLKKTWIHLLKHVTNVHNWYNGQCSHGPLDDGDREWIKRDSPAMQALRDVVLDKKFLKSLAFYTRFRHTGKLESYHSHRLMYAPKRFGFGYEGLLARSYLAAIDHNHHLHRTQAQNKKGELIYSRRWSKRAKRWKVVIVKESKTYSYLPVMCARVMESVCKQTMKRTKPLTYEQDPKKVAPTIASMPAPSTSDLVKEHISRF